MTPDERKAWAYQIIDARAEARAASDRDDELQRVWNDGYAEGAHEHLPVSQCRECA